MDLLTDDTMSMAARLENLRARLPVGWAITGPVAERDGWTFNLHAAADASLGTEVWRSRLSDAFRVFAIVVDEVIGNG